MTDTIVMLAHPYDEDKHLKKVEGWWISEKFDGVRGYWDGETMLSRKENEFTIPDTIKEQLQKIVDEEGNCMELDGELWFGHNTFALCSGTARRSKVNPEEWKCMKYMIFDTPDLVTPFEERIKKILKAVKKAGHLENVSIVEFKRFNPEKTTIKKQLQKVEEIGGEGLMLRKPESLYERKRSHNMLKVKAFSYCEGEVLGYIKGKTGKYSNMVGSLLVKDLNTEVVCGVGTGLTDWQRYAGEWDGDFKKKETQKIIDDNRIEKSKESKVDKKSEEYLKLIEIVCNKEGKEKQDALIMLNKTFMEMPTIGDCITYRFKERTATGAPSFPSFVGVRDYE